jgi:hypothetical protein
VYVQGAIYCEELTDVWAEMPNCYRNVRIGLVTFDEQSHLRINLDKNLEYVQYTL